MIKRLSSKPIIIKNKNFQTIQIKVLFPFVDKEENLAKTILLPSMLMYMNEKYDTEEKFQREKKKNYILGTGCSKIVVGTTGYFCFSMTVPDAKVLGINNLVKQFSFLEEMIYHPKVIDMGFDPFEVEREKKNLKMGIQNSIKKLKVYQTIKSLELVDDYGVLSRCVENHDYLIDEVTPQNLYEFYLSSISNKQPLIFVMGNVDKDEITAYVDKYLCKTNKRSISFDKSYNYFLKPGNENVKIVNEKSHFKDSSVSLFYKVQDMSEHDFIYLGLVKGLLSSLSSRLLSKKLRDQYELIYSSKVVTYPHFGLFEITAFINAKNRDLTVEKIKEVMNELKDVEYIEPFLEKLKERRRINLIKSLDDKYDIMEDVILKRLDIDMSRKENYEIVKNIEAKEIVEFVDRLKLDTIYFIEEDKYE